MTRNQIVKEAKARGFTHVLTADGPLPLEAWLAHAQRKFGFRYDAQIVDDRIVERGRLPCGVWPLVKTPIPLEPANEPMEPAA